jgi:hypothetical protein
MLPDEVLADRGIDVSSGGLKGADGVPIMHTGFFVDGNGGE